MHGVGGGGVTAAEVAGGPRERRESERAGTALLCALLNSMLTISVNRSVEVVLQQLRD